MKKQIILLAASIIPCLAFGQLRVSQSGNVTIGDSSANSYYPLNVMGSMGSQLVAKLKGYGSIMRIDMENHPNVSTSGTSHGIYVNSTYSTQATSYGITTTTFNSSSSSSSRAVGLFARGRSTYGAEYGVFGSVSNGTGAGIYGSKSAALQTPDGCYAGYFYGNVKVTGTIDGTLVSTSDSQLKENIQPLADERDDAGVLAKMDLLTPISYNYKDFSRNKNNLKSNSAEDADAMEDAGIYEDIDIEDEDTRQVMEKRHFGLIAQELQNVYPELVYKKSNGYLAVNYTELIPVLVQSIKELKAEVDVLKSAASKATRSSLVPEGGVSDGKNETAGLQDAEIAEMASMDQNMPNPFTEKTDIAIYLPESVKSATLYIYDLSGKQLEQHPVMGRGETVMTIHADKMNAGMYVYSLIADGKVVTTKKMIVVK